MSDKLFNEQEIEILRKNITTTGNRWRSQYILGGASRLQDTHKLNNGRPTTKDLSLEKKYKKLQEKIEFLEAENEFFKKLDQLERGVLKLK